MAVEIINHMESCWWNWNGEEVGEEALENFQQKLEHIGAVEKMTDVDLQHMN